MEEKIETIVPLLVDAIDRELEREGTISREKDELTLALGNPEHVGRVRALGGGVTLKEAFSDCADSYRSRGRKKKQELDRLSELERRVQRQQEQLDSISQQRASQQQLEGPEVEAVPSDQRKSSVGST